MKTFIYIFSCLFLLTIMSCEKEDIRPNSTNSDLENRSNHYNNLNDKRDSPAKSGPSSRPNNKDGVLTANDSIFNITDPNRDEDDERRGVKGKSR